MRSPMVANITAITAILHTCNDGLRIARAVESLRSCEEVMVIDHGSGDDTCAIARKFGARVIAATTYRPDESTWTRDAANDWIFRMSPAETVSEPLEAALLEWKLAERPEQAVVVAIMEETRSGWVPRSAETRLTHRNRGGPGADTEDLHTLDGSLLRLMSP